jgi:hypothetical protein
MLRWGYFGAWAVGGAGLALSLAAAFTIGPFVLVLAALGIGVLVSRRPARGPAAFGAIAGPAVIVFWIAWLNRGGPGDVCSSSAHGESCTEEWSPWPFVAVGVVLLVVAVFLYVRAERRRGTTPAVRLSSSD